MTSSRQLAAIMFTDMVGYTALMGKNSDRALELVRISKNIQKPLVEKHNGKWLKEMGDGAMAQFSTAMDAVNCSIEIQEIARGKLDAKLRIGIHLGDVTVEENDVHGDGVNVASRLESVADPGGIYISESIEKAIRGQGEIQAKYLGEIKLKNVDYDVRAYALQGTGLPVPHVEWGAEISGRLGAELQRRGVLRAGISFIAISLLLVLLLGQIQTWISFPQWSMPALIILLIATFPGAMYLAWNYERSPEGLVKTTSKQSWRNPYTDNQRKPLTGNVIIMVLIVMVVSLFAYPRYFGNGDQRTASLSTTPVLGKNSIAVIPFENLSNDEEQEYFSDGITEDILNQLAKIENLRVKSRTSTLQYKKTTRTIPEIGNELGVGFILEGSVRKAGNQVRIMAQLIDVQTDEHVWSESYDREITQIFAIQSEVAKEIARILELKLSTKEDIYTKTGSGDITAYDYFLRAREISNNFNRGDQNAIIELLQQAISLDPSFADAYALLSGTLYYRGFGLSREIWLDSALILANKAIKLDPDNADGYVIRGIIRNNSLGEHAKAGQDFEEAFELEPNNPLVLETLGRYLMRNDDPERGASMFVESIELRWSSKDPQYYLAWGDVYSMVGEFNKARNLFLQAEKLAPEWNLPKGRLGTLASREGDYTQAISYYKEGGYGYTDPLAWSYYRAGDLDNAEKTWLRLLEAEKNMEDTTQYFAVRHRLGMVYLEKGEKQKAKQLFEEQIKLNQRDIDQQQIPAWIRSIGSSIYDLAITKAYIGETDEALELAEHPEFLWGSTVHIFSWYLDNDPMLEPLRNNPRFVVVADKWRNKVDAANEVFRRIILEREATEQMELELRK